MGSASSKCSESAVWCRHMVQRWRNHAASRLQRYRRRRRIRILGRIEYCESCAMRLRGPIQLADHVIGKKHIRNERRRTMLPENIVRRNVDRQRMEILASIGLRKTECALRNTECASILAHWARRINPKYKTQTRFGVMSADLPTDLTAGEISKQGR